MTDTLPLLLPTVPGKDDGYRIEREFAHHIAEREYQ